MNKEKYLKINSNLFYSANKTRQIEIIVSFKKCNNWHYEAIIRDSVTNSAMFIIMGTTEYKILNDCGTIENFIYATKEINYCFIKPNNDYSYFNETLKSTKYIINSIFINEIMEREDNE